MKASKALAESFPGIFAYTPNYTPPQNCNRNCTFSGVLVLEVLTCKGLDACHAKQDLEDAQRVLLKKHEVLIN